MQASITAGPGANLFALAATNLQDATQWIRIAQQNGLSDPFISAVQILQIPDVNLTLTGGIPQSQ